MIRRSIIFLVTVIFSSHAAAEELKEYYCGILFVENGSSNMQLLPFHDFRLTDYNENRVFVGLDPLEGAKTTGILCDRSSLVPYKYDYQAVLAGYPLYIKSADRMAIVDFKDGRFSYELLKGQPLTKPEKEEIDAMLEYFQSQKGSTKNA